MTDTAIRSRNEIPEDDTWDLESIYPTREAFEAAFKKTEAALADITAFKGRLAEGPDTLSAYFKTVERVVQDVGKIFVYSRLKYATDTANQDAAALNDRGGGLFARFQAAASFGDPELMAIGFDTLREWMQEKAELAILKQYLNELEQRAAHVRSSDVEELLGAVQDPFRTSSATHGVLANADVSFKPAVDSKGNAHEVTHSNISQHSGKLFYSTDRDLRRSAWENYADGHLAYRNTMANALAAGVKQDVFMARARKYDSSLAAALGAGYIPPEVFHSLIDTYKANIPTWHRYWEVRKKALKLKELYVYDTRAALTEKMPTLTFDKAFEWISEGMKPLGEEYVGIMRNGVLEERWVDRYPNKGKRSGAFSSGFYGTHPYIMMSFNDDIFGLSTLAHELGHSMHSYFSRREQPLIYSDYGLFVAEVASNFNQALVRDYLLKTQTDRDLQIAIIEEAMSNFHRYFFLMPTLARFELEIHERAERGQGLTAQGMIDLMADLMSEGYGPGVVVDRERTGSLWMQFSTHLYLNFYVFQYATGISGAHALAERVLNGGAEERNAFLSMLEAGGSVYPLDALKLAGVDLRGPEAVEKTFAVLSSYVDRLETLVG
ncbi:MAG: oligoendopeptidase F [Anaerolineae bacterium]|nr:MAG: oligoendopeptidase F [Anaerolineae bacterium]